MLERFILLGCVFLTALAAANAPVPKERALATIASAGRKVPDRKLPGFYNPYFMSSAYNHMMLNSMGYGMTPFGGSPYSMYGAGRMNPMMGMGMGMGMMNPMMGMGMGMGMMNPMMGMGMGMMNPMMGMGMMNPMMGMGMMNPMMMGMGGLGMHGMMGGMYLPWLMQTLSGGYGNSNQSSGATQSQGSNGTKIDRLLNRRDRDNYGVSQYALLGRDQVGKFAGDAKAIPEYGVVPQP